MADEEPALSADPFERAAARVRRTAHGLDPDRTDPGAAALNLGRGAIEGLLDFGTRGRDFQRMALGIDPGELPEIQQLTAPQTRAAFGVGEPEGLGGYLGQALGNPLSYFGWGSPQAAVRAPRLPPIEDLPIGRPEAMGPGVIAGPEGAAAVKALWARESPIKSIEDLFTHAQTNQDTLAAVAEPVAESMGLPAPAEPWWKPSSGFSNPGVKGRPRTQEKIDQGKPPGRINDVVRGRFLVDKPEQADRLVEHLGKHFEVADEGWTTTDQGYFDRKALVRFPNGQVGEVQFWHPELLKAKESTAEGGGGGHELYEQWRSLPLAEQKSAKGDALVRQMQELYSGARSRLGSEWDKVLK